MINKILVIDDDIVYCNAMKYHFSQMKYDVSICTSYNEFNHKIDINEFDVILLDLRLKDAQGLDILHDISKLDHGKRVIIISSYLDNENISRAENMGVFTCIPKSTRLFDELDVIIKKM